MNSETIEDFEPLDLPPVQPGKPNFFKYSPGRRAENWQDDHGKGLLRLSFKEYETGDLRQFSTQGQLNLHVGRPESPANNATWNLFLLKDARIGDLVFANKGVREVVGIGVIDGEYAYFEGEDFPHRRPVRWITDKAWTYKSYQIDGYPELFRRDTFSPSRIGPQILRLYLEAHPEYLEAFQKFNWFSEIMAQTPPASAKNARNHALNTILFGPPGTGKTFSTIRKAVQILGFEFEDGESGDQRAKTKFDEMRREGQIEFVTFHQNYAYEDFVLGIRPDLEAGDGQMRFRRHEGIFYKICQAARRNWEKSRSSAAALPDFEAVLEDFLRPLADDEQPIEVQMRRENFKFRLTSMLENERGVLFEKNNGGTIDNLYFNTLADVFHAQKKVRPRLGGYYSFLAEALKNHQKTMKTVEKETEKRFVLIIDEINRANISRVFGELITLLEDDKRLGASCEMRVSLPSGEQDFGVPPNLFLIGTMNTADKSIALLDIALRRRFEFEAVFPDGNLIGDEGLRSFFSSLNKAIFEAKKSPDFGIGHAFFMRKTMADLPVILSKKIIPLLLEYFGNRAEKVAEILERSGHAVRFDETDWQWKTSEI